MKLFIVKCGMVSLYVEARDILGARDTWMKEAPKFLEDSAIGVEPTSIVLVCDLGVLRERTPTAI